MEQKFGGAIGGAAVLWMLSGFGYVTDAEQLASGAVQPDEALQCLWWLMSFIPACVASLSVFIVWFYPLTTSRVETINAELKRVRKMAAVRPT
jgi:GPH family glycoside/pentoside/hexuronide:cation symporter